MKVVLDKFYKFLLNIMFHLIKSVLLIFVAIGILMIFITNDKIELTNIDIQSDKVSNSIKIVQISDLHDAEFGENNSELINKIIEQNPDLIVATGDMFDSARTDINKTYDLFLKLNENSKCSIIYIPGNHEIARTSSYTKLKSMLEATNVHVIENDLSEITLNDNILNIICIDNNIKYNVSKLENIIDNNKNINFNHFNLVLCHYPENFNSLIDCNIPLHMDLILSGHAHGGQIRIFGKSLYAPNQGFNPYYTNGLYELKNNTKLIVNRGLGNSQFPLRINNKPEITVINIYKEATTDE